MTNSDLFLHSPALSHPETWVEQYADSLFSHAVFRLRDTHIAEEVVQETFLAALAAWKKGSTIRAASEKSWLLAILQHKIIDYLRTKYRHQLQHYDSSDEETISRYFEDNGDWRLRPGRWGREPQQHCEAQELLRLIQLCLAILQPKQADAFSLREVDDMDTEEVCQLLGITKTNFYVLMHRARLEIRQCLENHWQLPTTSCPEREKL